MFYINSKYNLYLLIHIIIHNISLLDDIYNHPIIIIKLLSYNHYYINIL
jgi:hypothetical protein